MATTLSDITEAFKLDTADAITCVHIINGIRDPLDFARVDSYARRCYGEPDASTLKLMALDEIIEGFGLESVRDPDDEFHYQFSYVNTGDTYTATFIYDEDTGEFHVTNVGDYIEKLEREKRLCA